MRKRTSIFALIALILAGVNATSGADEQISVLSPKTIFSKRAGSEVRNSIDQKLCWCPAGSFMMGSPVKEPDRSYDEEQVKVTINTGFWISKFEVTEREYKLIRKRTPKNPSGDNFPVVDMRSGDARQFAEKLTDGEHQSGMIPKDWVYAVPTEAEWEYACRAGSTTAFAFGDRENQLPDFANFADSQLLKADDSAYRYAHRKLDDGFPRLAPVGSFKPNAWGIHDMHGNVWEWCSDTYFQKLPGGVDPIANGKGGERGRVIRGGSWLSHSNYCRSAMRNAHHDLNSANYIGFRVVLKRAPQQLPD